jgi:hypothetical protein
LQLVHLTTEFVYLPIPVNKGGGKLLDLCVALFKFLLKSKYL